MNHKRIAGYLTTLVLVTCASGWAAQNILLNGSMESGAGPLAEDPHIPADWTLQGSVVERSDEANLVPAGEGHALKAFASQPQELAYQEVDVVTGDAVTISASLYTRSSDKLGGTAQAGIVLEFYNSGGGQVGGSFVSFVLTASSPADTWIAASIGPHNAPTGAVKARMTCVWTWSGAPVSGSAFWDGCSLTIDGGPNKLLNSDFEQAGIGEQSPTGIDDWLGFNDQEQSQDFAFDGESSLKVGTDDSFSGLYQNMRVLADGDHLLLRAKVFNSTSSNGLTGDARAGIKLEFYPPEGGTLPPPTENLPFDADSPVDSWELVDLGTTGLVVPEDATLARIVLIYVAADVPTNGAVYYDATIAEVSSAPTVNQLSNSSFEVGDGGRNGLTFWTEFWSGTGEAQKSNFEVPGYPDEFFEASMRATGDSTSGIYQEIPVTPGETLIATVYMRMRPDNKLEGNARAGIKVEWVAGTVPPWVDITPGPSDNTITADSPKDTWLDLQIDYIMPAGTEAGTRFVDLVASGTSGTGDAYFDVCEAVVLNRFDGADADGDDDEDLFDFWKFQWCFEGEGVTPPKWNCTVFDHDDDGDVDGADYDYFEPRMTGP